MCRKRIERTDELTHTAIISQPSHSIGPPTVASKTSFKWRFAGGQMVARFICLLGNANMRVMQHFDNKSYAQSDQSLC